MPITKKRAPSALAQINPTRDTEILKRGYEYGQSRMICGAQWQTDVDAGRLMGAALFARLQSFPEFQQWMQAARKEINLSWVISHTKAPLRFIGSRRVKRESSDSGERKSKKTKTDDGSEEMKKSEEKESEEILNGFGMRT